MLRLLVPALVGMSLSACQLHQDQSQLTDSLDPRTYSPEVELDGPVTVKAKPYEFVKDDGKAFTIKIDQGTIRDCFARTGYRVSKLQDAKYLVEIEPLMVPAVVCQEDWMHDIETGTEIVVPADEHGFNGATVLIMDQTWRRANATVEVEAEGSAVQTFEKDTIAIDKYSYFGRSNAPLKIAVDHHTESGCGPAVGYLTTELQDGHFIDIGLAPRRAFCPPDMIREHKVGVTLDIPANDDGYQWGRILVTSNPLNEGEPVEVKILGVKDTGDLEGVDKMIECNVYDDGGQIFELRLGLGYEGGKEDLVIQSRSSDADDWTTDYKKSQSTAVYEGQGVTALLGEGLARQEYKASLDWNEDSRLKDRCFAFLPNYYFELNQHKEVKGFYTGNLEYSASFATKPDQSQCPSLPQVQPAQTQNLYLKCAAID